MRAPRPGRTGGPRRAHHLPAGRHAGCDGARQRPVVAAQQPRAVAAARRRAGRAGPGRPRAKRCPSQRRTAACHSMSPCVVRVLPLRCQSPAAALRVLASCASLWPYVCSYAAGLTPAPAQAPQGPRVGGWLAMRLHTHSQLPTAPAKAARPITIDHPHAALQPAPILKAAPCPPRPAMPVSSPTAAGHGYPATLNRSLWCWATRGRAATTATRWFWSARGSRLLARWWRLSSGAGGHG